MGCNCGGSRERRELAEQLRQRRREEKPRQRLAGPLEGIYWQPPQQQNPQPQKG